MKQKNITNIIPESRPEPSVIFDILFWFFLVLLAALVGFYFKFSIQQSNLTSELSQTKAEIELQSKTDLKKDLSQQSKRIDRFVQLFKNQDVYSKLLQLLKDKTLPRVYFSSLHVDSSKKTASLTGKAGSFKELSQQILVLQEEENIKGLEVSNFSLNREGVVDFNLLFTFSKDLIKR